MRENIIPGRTRIIARWLASVPSRSPVTRTDAIVKIAPSSMGLNAAALPIIWVAAGGRKDVTAVLAATVSLAWVSQQLAVYGSQYALILMGLILLAVVLFAPEGFVVSAWKALERKLRRRTERVPSSRGESASAVK